MGKNKTKKEVYSDDSEIDQDFKPDDEEEEYNEVETQFRDDYSDAGTDFDNQNSTVSDGTNVFPEGCYWAYLIVNFDRRKKIHTYIGKSRNPIQKCELWNLKEKKSRRNKNDTISNSNEETKLEENAECWQIELVIGPFMTKEEATSFKLEWREKSRGIKPRRDRGKSLARKYNKTSYDARM